MRGELQKKLTLVRGSAVPEAADSLPGRRGEIKRLPYVCGEDKGPKIREESRKKKKGA